MMDNILIKFWSVENHYFSETYLLKNIGDLGISGFGEQMTPVLSTGKVDSNEKPIFLGDIVELNRDGCTYRGQICWDKFHSCFEVREEETEHLLDIHKQLTIVGNIFENPEMVVIEI